MNATERIAAHPALAEMKILELQAQLTWRPIATAPKDGTRILLLGRSGRVADGLWDVVTQTWIWPYIRANPTHWLPLLPLLTDTAAL